MTRTAQGQTEPCPCEEAKAVPVGAGTAFSGWVTQLVREHRSRLVAVARREGLGAEDAFDAAQEAFTAYLILPQARELVESEWAAHTLVALVRNVSRNAQALAVGVGSHAVKFFDRNVVALAVLNAGKRKVAERHHDQGNDRAKAKISASLF